MSRVSCYLALPAGIAGWFIALLANGEPVLYVGGFATFAALMENIAKVFKIGKQYGADSWEAVLRK